MTLSLTTNRSKRIINLHPTFFDRINLNSPEINKILEEKVKPLVKDLAKGEKIRHVTIGDGSELLYNFSSSLPKDFEKHNPLASERDTFFKSVQRSHPAGGHHLQNARRDKGKINFLRS